MSEYIKKTAITAAGYIYQNRQGLKVLCDWLDAPTRYSRVKFECDNENEAPQGLDDIVIERSDGRIDLQQIKFTPDTDKHFLSWDWMLEKTGKTARSRSMLRKWFDAFKQLKPNQIGEISLITNRRPDANIEVCLELDKINPSKIPEPQRTQVEAELGGIKECELFFEQLCIRHSDKGYLALEHEVDARLRVYGTSEGIAVLKNVALNWAIQKNYPAPDGWISQKELRDILRASPPTPLPEDFVIPKGYEVPDEIFHQQFVQSVINATEKVIVLTGPPGRGKSTYLSALCDTLTDQGIPTVRHHYFLSTTERSRDRVNSYIVEQSIQAQIQQFHEDVPKTSGGLYKQLEACAEFYKMQGKPFILILDGLDHVWRINSEDKQPLDDLFSQIIPCPDNMILLVGTQPVNDIQLPTDLLAAAPKSEWYTLPAMSESAVLSYLRKVLQEGRLTTSFGTNLQIEEQLQDAAFALRKRTNGHPLYIIYATAELEHSGLSLSGRDIDQLKGDLSKDAKFYYASLWVHLLPSQKDTLRLICAFPFFWPKTAFLDIARNIKATEPNVDKIEHLLHSSTAGLKVFHESLAVFVRSTDGYEERINQLMPAVADWLEHQGPSSLCVNWLWTVQAKMGNPNNLITGLTRDWIMRRLEEGYPVSLFDMLLSDALVIALESAKFADAYRLSHLKNRMVDGSKFQVQYDDFARLVSFSLTLAEESVIREAFASRHEADILDVAALGLALHYRGEHVLAEICGEEALHRFKGVSQFSHRYNSNSGFDEFTFLASSFAKLGVVGATSEELTWLVDKNESPAWLPCVQILIDDGRLDDLMAVVAALPASYKKHIVSDACIRAAANIGVYITEREDFNTLVRTPFVAAIEAALTKNSIPLNDQVPVNWLHGSYYERKDNLALLAHNWLFGAVHLNLCMIAEGQTNFEHITAPIYEDRENITDYLNVLSEIGSQIAQRWWCGEFIHFHELYELLEPVELQRFRQSYHSKSAASDFQAALHRIACDVHIGSVLLAGTGTVTLSPRTIEAALQCTWFDSASFRTQYSSDLLSRMTDEAAVIFIGAQRLLLDAGVQNETSVHLQIPLQLCMIAISHRLNSEARELCTQTWELTIGYGHRKDPTLSNTVDAIAYLADVEPKEACRLLAKIAPQIHCILDYTDGKGTRHVLSEADRLLAKLKPSALVIKFEEHTSMGDWALAESSIRAYIKQGAIEEWPLDALMRTGLHPGILDDLQQLIENGCTTASERLRILEEHNGWDIGCIRDHENSGSGTDDKLYKGDVTVFGPDKLEDLLKDLDPYYKERPKLLRTWYQYWESRNQGRNLLIELDRILFTGNNKWMREALDLSEFAFQTKRRASGLSAAWKYLIHAQIRNGGWIGYFENMDVTRNRLDLIAQNYPQRCDEFVTATAYSMFDEPVSSRLAPSEIMVYFYVKQNRIDEAVKFTETMVNCVIEDTRTLPLEKPCWMTELIEPISMEVK